MNMNISRESLIDLVLSSRNENYDDHVHVENAAKAVDKWLEAHTLPPVPEPQPQPEPEEEPEIEHPQEPTPEEPQLPEEPSEPETPAEPEQPEPSTPDGERLYKAPQQVDQYVKDTAELAIIADQPQAVWFNGESPWSKARELFTKANDRGELAVIAIYAIPGRDNGNYSSGGLASAQAYYDYIGALADGIGDRKGIAILEPDALGLSREGLTDQKREERRDMLHGAVKALKNNCPNLKVFIDASGWVGEDEQAALLDRVNIKLADGFVTNTSGYTEQSKVEAYVHRVMVALRNRNIVGKIAVIDTSRNGNGEWQTNEKDPWCNPPGRKLGIRPSFDTSNDEIYAYLWVKNPGESDGNLRGPNAGQFSKELALALIHG